MERARFFAFLGEHGVAVVTPKASKYDRLIEEHAEGEYVFYGYCYPYLPGETLKPEKWTDTILENWGELIGQIHRLSQEYPFYIGLTDPSNGEMTLNWQYEMQSLINHSEDDELRKWWLGLKKQVTALPATRQTMGMVQNDPHHENILLHGDALSLLDFDVSLCHFFASDIAIAIQSVLFTRSGGMERPLDNKDALRRFIKHLIKGYRRVIDFPSEAWEAVDLFIAYRRGLLFTFMNDWLKTQDSYNSWKNMMLTNPPIVMTLKDI
jgi:Ser/Thr protein kinase RdoA (MazF antagonist)